MEKNPQNIKNALCYVPLVAFAFYFTEDKKTAEFKRHTIYWMILFWVFLILELVLASFLKGIVLLVYIWVSAFLWYKAYIWEDVKIKEVDEFIEKKSKKEDKEEKQEDIFEWLDK